MRSSLPVSSWLAPTLVVVLLAAGSHQVLHSRREKAKRLKDRTPIFDLQTLHYVSLIKLEPQSSAEQLIQSVHDHSGHVCYIGKVVTVFVPTPQFLSNDFDVVLHSNWPDPASFELWRGAYQAKDHKFQRFDRPVLKNFFMANMIHGVLPTIQAMKAKVFGTPYDLSPSEEPTASDESPSFRSWKSLQEAARLLEEDISGDTNDPVLWWNWEVAVQGPEFWANLKYGIQFVPMLALNGGGGMHGGNALGGNGTFDKMLAVYYPSRHFVIRMLRSTFFYEAVKGKNPGAGISLITVPYPVPSSST